MKKFLQRSCSWLVMLVAMFAVSMSASAQDATINASAGETSNGGATISGGYGYSDNTYFCGPQESMVISASKTITKIVLTENSNYRSYGSWTASPNSCSTSGAVTTWEGEATSVTFTNPLTSRLDYLAIDKVEVWYADGGTVDPVDPGTGGGNVDPVDPTPSGQPLNVTFDFSKGFVAEKDGVTCESDGRYNSVYGWQVQSGKYVTFTAPYGFLISEIVLTDSNYGISLGYTVSAGTLSGDTWTGSASSVTFTSTGYSRMTTAAITLVKDPNAKELFAFTGATPAAGTVLESLGTFTLALPNGVNSLTGFGSTISVNGNNTGVSAHVNSDGTGLIITLDKAIVTDGRYTVVVPQEFATAGSGAINAEYTVQYSVNSPVFELTADNFSPKPGDDIELDLANGQVFEAVNVIYPAGITLNEGTVAFSIDGKKVSGTFTDYDGRGVLNFEAFSITTRGSHTFEFPAGAFTSTTGKKSTALTLTYEVGVKHNKYNVLLTAGTDAMPADATITVAGADYKNGDVISVITVLTESDITNTDVDGFNFKSVEIKQPQTVTNGAVIVTYEKIIPRVEYTEITPAAEVNLDERNFGSICIKFPENFSTDYLEAPAGFSLTDPAGQQIALSTPYGFTGWSSGGDLYINFPSQHTLGTYTLDIPADAITFVSGQKNQAIHFEWTLSAEYFNFESYSNSEAVKKYTDFSLQAPEGVTFETCNVKTLKRVKREVGSNEETSEPIYEDVPVNVNLTGSAVTFTFTTPFTEKGSVSLVLPEGAIIATDARKNREFRYSQFVDPTEYIDIVSTTPKSYVTVDGPLTSIVLTLGSELNLANVTFGKTISYNWNTDLPVTATLSGTKLTLTFDDANIKENYGTTNNSFGIPEGFIKTTDGAISRSEGIYNVRINAPKVPLELTGIRLGSESGELVTESGAKVEKVGMLVLQFPESVEAAENADFSTITVTDGNGNPCDIYQGQGWFNYEDGKSYSFSVWVNPQMTEIGTYTLHVPAGLFVGTDSGNVNAEINFELVIADVETFEPETSIKDRDEVDTLTELVLNAPAGVTFSHFTDYPANFFYLTGEGITGDGKVYMRATVAEDGKTATLELGNIKKNGEYTITVPKGYLRGTTPNTGNAELTIHVTVNHKVLEWDANDNGTVEVSDVNAAVSAALERGYYGMGGSSDDDAAVKALDLNGDGKVTIGEITKLIEYIKQHQSAK